jgi:5,6-dimethylbenzimidazole synthase
MDLDECIAARRDTRHFLLDAVPQEVLDRALHAAHRAPSVGLSEPWRFVVVRSPEVKRRLLESFAAMRAAAERGIPQEARRALHASLKLEAIVDAPVGIGLFCERPSLGEYTIGVQGSADTVVWSCACAVQNLWLSLTAQGFGAGWVSILEFDRLCEILEVPTTWEPLGYLCVGKPATDYGKQPMLESLGWKTRSVHPQVRFL